MKRHSKGTAYDTTIHGDEIENNRIQLEHNLQKTDLSFHLSTTSDDENRDYLLYNQASSDARLRQVHNDSSVEYPRHLSEPDFPSFSHNNARDNFDDEDYSQQNGWSRHTDDDLAGINPYGGETVSTAAHHASAVTISAGLGGGKRRREHSLSGAEYDSDRPLQEMIAGVNSKLSMFDRSKNLINMTYDPLVVDGTAELDKILEPYPQHQHPSASFSVHPTPPTSSPSSSDSEEPVASSSRPKLTDHLRHMSFSPKRPRSRQPKVPVGGSPSRNSGEGFAIPISQPVQRTSLLVNPIQGKKHAAKVKIQLPDVTGLTSAVESPDKYGGQYYSYKAGSKARESEARVLQILTAVQNQLSDLEEENSISRRRVRELEMELDECKREVARERTKLFKLEELNFPEASGSRYKEPFSYKSKGKSKEGYKNVDEERMKVRYKEIVDEKKALEALIHSLRSHLTRLTSELASHQALLVELRKLRESDSVALREKGEEILQLKDEVQRLAGEVEVLRNVVEEGLKERRASREIQEVVVQNSVADIAMSQDLSKHEMADLPNDVHNDSISEEHLAEPVFTTAPPSGINRGSRSIRTDFATLGSTHLAESTQAGEHFVGDEELDDIAADVEERRSLRSNTSFEPIVQQSQSLSSLKRNIEIIPGSPQYSFPQGQIHLKLRHEKLSSEPLPPRAVMNVPLREQCNAEEEPYFPKIRGQNLERLFFSAREHNTKTCNVCYRRQHHKRNAPTNAPALNPSRNVESKEADEGYVGSEEADIMPTTVANSGEDRNHVVFSKDPAHWRRESRKYGIPPQTLVARVIRELEDDFTHYKSIYVELADQYKIMDAASDIHRRNTLANHLKEVIGILEQKGDQIASLYNLLKVTDKSII